MSQDRHSQTVKSCSGFYCIKKNIYILSQQNFGCLGRFTKKVEDHWCIGLISMVRTY